MLARPLTSGARTCTYSLFCHPGTTVRSPLINASTALAATLQSSVQAILHLKQRPKGAKSCNCAQNSDLIPEDNLISVKCAWRPQAGPRPSRITRITLGDTIGKHKVLSDSHAEHDTTEPNTWGATHRVVQTHASSTDASNT